MLILTYFFTTAVFLPSFLRLCYQRNTLSEWKEWRTAINEGLSKDILRNTYRDIPVGDNFENLNRPSEHPGRSVYHYSTAEDQATGLTKRDYINFGKYRAH